MKIKKRYINDILLQIHTFEIETGKPISGLLTENIGMGLRRKLQKIRKELLAANQEVIEQVNELKERFKDDEPKLLEEFTTLSEEEVTLNADYAMLSEIDKIESATNYNSELIEMIAR